MTRRCVVVDGPSPGCEQCGTPLRVPRPDQATAVLACHECGHEHDLVDVIRRAFEIAQVMN